jgi:hypothetical protein
MTAEAVDQRTTGVSPQEGSPMTTKQIAASENRFRSAFVATLFVITFVAGIGAGFALSRVIAGGPAVVGTTDSLPGAGNDMSAAAYAAQHPSLVRTIGTSPNDMSAAAHAVRQASSVRESAATRDDMSSAAYAAMHKPAAPGDDMSAAAYAAMHDH